MTCGLRDARRSGVATVRRRGELVELGNHCRDRATGGGPGRDVGVVGPAPGRGEQHRPRDGVDVAPAEDDIGAERPADRPGVHEPLRRDVRDGRPKVMALPAVLVEGALARARAGGGPAGVEAQDADPGERRKPPGALADQVAVHRPPVRGQRVAEHDDRGGIGVLGERPLADQAHPVLGEQRGWVAAGWKHRVGGDEGHGDKGRRAPGSSRAPSGTVGPAGSVPVPAELLAVVAVGPPGDDVRRARHGSPARTRGTGRSSSRPPR